LANLVFFQMKRDVAFSNNCQGQVSVHAALTSFAGDSFVQISLYFFDVLPAQLKVLIVFLYS